MPFFKVPVMLLLFLVLFTGGKILPFLFIAFGLMILMRALTTTTRTYQLEPSVSAAQLDDLRSEVAVTLLDMDNDDRIRTNPDARTRIRTAGKYYTRASTAVDRGVHRRDRDDVARALYRARYELEAASAELDGRAAPEPPDELQKTPPARAPRAQARYRHHRVGCRW